MNYSEDLKSLMSQAEAMGRGNDTLLAHITPEEAALLKSRGGAGTRNPQTGLLEFDKDEEPETKVYDSVENAADGDESDRATGVHGLTFTQDESWVWGGNGSDSDSDSSSAWPFSSSVESEVETEAETKAEAEVKIESTESLWSYCQM